MSSVLILAPEPPYPLHGGGAYRTASLVHYFARFADVDLVLFSESGKPALLPDGLVRSQTVIPLPVHGKGTLERYFRNARRVLQGVPPLIDRLSGLEPELSRILTGRRYDIGLVEHFWCAPYIATLHNVCAVTILDMHNVESVLNKRCAEASRGLIAAGHRRFGGLSAKLESKLLPLYSLVLATSDADAALIRTLAPQAHVAVYPNALPYVEIPRIPERDYLVFSANFEYHPNIDAVAFLLSEIWPLVKRDFPYLRLRLVGRGDSFIHHLIAKYVGSDVETTGTVEDTFHEIAQAKIVVAPLRAGSGTRIKILEAWAAARPVVATSLAAEGLQVRNTFGGKAGDNDAGDNIALASGAADFASAIARLLKDGDARQRMGANGRQTFEDLYTWEKAWRGLDREREVADSHLQVKHPEQLNRYTG